MTLPVVPSLIRNLRDNGVLSEVEADRLLVFHSADMALARTRVFRDVERVVAEWTDTMSGDDARYSVVRGMAAELDAVLRA